MKLIPILSSLLFIGSEYVQALSNCSTCRAVTVEDGISWGVENNDWCSKFKILIIIIVQKKKNK